jgi:hypothetical protein
VCDARISRIDEEEEDEEEEEVEEEKVDVNNSNKH